MDLSTQNSVLDHISALELPKWGPIGEVVYNRTYSRVKDDGTKETWADTVDRVTSTIEDPEERLRVAELIYGFKMVPAGRHLWITGTGLVYTRNCFVCPMTETFADHFEFMGSQLMTGGGVGANYSVEYLTLAPKLNRLGSLYLTIDRGHDDYEEVKRLAGERWAEPKQFNSAVEDRYYNHGEVMLNKVDDTREGWVDAWGLLFSHSVSSASCSDIYIDLSLIRAKGQPIKTFGGTASGPGPLAGSLSKIFGVLKTAAGRHLTSIEAMECDHYLAEAIAAGGSRRSARMSIVHWDDPNIFEFINCKADHMLHWSTNISVEVDDRFFEALERKEIKAVMVARATVKGMIENGEPGFYNSSLSSEYEPTPVRTTNPCGEITMDQQGGESCLIGSVNLAAFGVDDDGANEAFIYMTRMLVRATLTVPDHNLTAITEAKNRRIGVGFFGFQEWAAAHNVKYSEIHKSEILESKLVSFRETIRRTADSYADELGIPRPVKVTAIAPNGTISILPGVQPGIHPVLAKYFKRRVRFTEGDPLIGAALIEGKHIEPCIYSHNTMVVENVVRDGILDDYPDELIEQSDEISLETQLATLEFVTKHFTSGKDGNAVSFTANIPSDQLDNFEQVFDTVMDVLPRVKGLTVFPAATRPQQPIEAMSKEEYNQYHGIVEAHGSSMDGDSCSIGGACPIR